MHYQIRITAMRSIRHIFLGALLLTGSLLFAQTTDWDTNTIGKVYYTGGNVGIGLSDPQSVLHIKKVDLSASQEIEFLTGSITSSYKLQIGLNDDGVNFTNNSSSRGFNFKNAAHDDLLIINENGRVKIAENSASAGVKLEVNGFTRLNGFSIASPALGIKSNGTANSFLIAEASSSSNRVLDMVENNNGSFIRLYKDGTSNTQISAVGDSYFNGGNLGIGTTSPSQKFEILSGKTDGTDAPVLRLTSDDTNAEVDQLLGEIQFYNNDLDGSHISSFIKSIASETYGRQGYLTFGTTGTNSTDAVERMRIATNGNVGIGTTTPSEKLEIEDDVQVRLRLQETGGNKMNIMQQETDSYILTDGAFRLYTNGTERIYAASAGNIGIGTSNPNQNLEISSGLNDGTEAPVLRLTSKDINAIQDQLLGEIQFYSKDADSTHISSFIKAIASETYGRQGYLTFGTTGVNRTDAVEKMRIDPNGNVGIGTTNPGTYKLAVEGQIGARSVKVTQAAWADYVFAPSYQLMPLNEVEAYITQNQHLPNVPSAKEVEENGFVLEEMDAKLMEKIEELTLYTIQQQKSIENLMETIENQNSKIKKLEEKLN